MRTRKTEMKNRQEILKGTKYREGKKKKVFKKSLWSLREDNIGNGEKVG